MKFRNLLFFLLCSFALIGAFSSCSDDDDEASWKAGSKVELPNNRAFVLTKGSNGNNTSHLYFYNADVDTTSNFDIYLAHNGKKLGDTGNDMLTYGGDIYIVMNASKYVVRLNGAGMEQARYSFDDKLGQPRFAVVDNDKLYVTSYGGYVVRLNVKTLSFEDTVKVDKNPEEIIAYQGNLYCVNSGYGKGHTMSIINEESFNSSKSVGIVSNPYGLKEANGHIYIQSYDASYNSLVCSYDVSSQKCDTIGYGSRIFAYGDKLYMANSTSKNWVNYTSTFSVYDALTKKTSEWDLTKAPSVLASSIIYMVERNPYTGDFYIGTTDYYSDGTVYRFGSDGVYKTKFSAGGINPNSMVFLR